MTTTTTTTTADVTTPETKQLAIRLPVPLIERLEAHAKRLRAATPGVNVTRADALRALLIDACDYAEEQAREAETKAKEPKA